MSSSESVETLALRVHFVAVRLFPSAFGHERVELGVGRNVAASGTFVAADALWIGGIPVDQSGFA